MTFTLTHGHILVYTYDNPRGYTDIYVFTYIYTYMFNSFMRMGPPANLISGKVSASLTANREVSTYSGCWPADMGPLTILISAKVSHILCCLVSPAIQIRYMATLSTWLHWLHCLHGYIRYIGYIVYVGRKFSTAIL